MILRELFKSSKKFITRKRKQSYSVQLWYVTINNKNNAYAFILLSASLFYLLTNQMRNLVKVRTWCKYIKGISNIVKHGTAKLVYMLQNTLIGSGIERWSIITDISENATNNFM